jgi:NAD(P)-dependent dehydrogenase (short-subunit alcohol dehydrogenase family)
MKNEISNLFRLDGKVIVITGASGLLGIKHAEAVAAYGGIPVLIDINFKKLKNCKSEIDSKYKVDSFISKVDITNEVEVKKNAKEIYAKYGHIDGLVNNAANNPKVEDSEGKNFSRLENFTLESWNQDISVGLTGSFICSKHFGEYISRNPKGGSILNISSDLGLIAPDQRLYKKSGLMDHEQPVKPVTYSVIKSGLIGLTRYLSTYWNEKNVRCNAICPGGVENGQSEKFIKSVSSLIPMGRLAQSNEYQGTIIWMLSDASSYLNGAIIAVDGGRSSW